MTLPVVVCACGDPGGGNALAPVLLQLLRDRRVELRVLAYAQSLSLLRAQGIDAHEIECGATGGDFIEMLAQQRARLVLVATSHNDLNHEKSLVEAARRAQVPSLALLDFWSNYAVRFSAADGKLTRVPDRIAVMDAAAAAAVAAVGVEPARLVVTGHPGFDALADLRVRFDSAARVRLRAEIAENPQDWLVVFVSQPLRAMYGSDPSLEGFLGYDEHAIAQAVLAALERIATSSARRLTLVIRPHPREAADAFAELQSKLIRVRVVRDDRGRELSLASDMVVGMTSMLLVEAAELGCRVVSLQPERRVPQEFPGRAAQRMRIVERSADVERALAETLGSSVPAGETCAGDATQKVLKEVYAMLFRGERQTGAGT